MSSQQRYDTPTRKQDCYICGSYKKRTADCTAHFISTDLLKAGVTANLKAITGYAAKHEAQFAKLLMTQSEDGGKKKNAARRRELDAAEKRITELKGIFKRLYEDNGLTVITPHSMRHWSVSFKLLLSGDVKAVQADSGQKNTQMVLDRYSHVFTEERKKLAHTVEEAIYQKASDRHSEAL